MIDVVARSSDPRPARASYLVNRQITKNGGRAGSLFDVCYGGTDGKGWLGTLLLHKNWRKVQSVLSKMD